MFGNFISSYGSELLYLIITGLVGYFGLKIKDVCEKLATDKTKKDVIRTCVNAVEQVYKDLHGEEKYNMVVNNATEILQSKGITITELEIKMIVEECVKKLNESTQALWKD